MKRKKWSELEEQTLLSKYMDLLNSGALSKLKTREKKFKPIAEYVNSVHHLQDPLSYPFKWSWRDLSIKVQNMRHQYLGVKQKIKISENEYNWKDGEDHWENFLMYKQVFGDVELSEAKSSIKNVNFQSSYGMKYCDESGGEEMFDDEGFMGLGYGIGSEDIEDEYEYEGRGGDDVGVSEGEFGGERGEKEDNGVGDLDRMKKSREWREWREGKRLRMVGEQVFGDDVGGDRGEKEGNGVGDFDPRKKSRELRGGKRLRMVGEQVFGGDVRGDRGEKEGNEVGDIGPGEKSREWRGGKRLMRMGGAQVFGEDVGVSEGEFGGDRGEIEGNGVGDIDMRKKSSEWTGGKRLRMEDEQVFRGDVGVSEGEFGGEKVGNGAGDIDAAGKGKKSREWNIGQGLRMVGEQVLELRGMMAGREKKRREREWRREEREFDSDNRCKEREFRKEMYHSKRDEELEARDIEFGDQQIMWAKKEHERRVRFEKELDDERMRRMKLEEKWDEEEMQWKEMMLRMQIDHEKQMMQLHTDACQNQMQVLGFVARMWCQFFGSMNDGFAGGLGPSPPQVMQNLHHPGKLDTNSPSEFS